MNKSSWNGFLEGVLIGTLAAMIVLSFPFTTRIVALEARIAELEEWQKQIWIHIPAMEPLEDWDIGAVEEWGDD